MNKKKLRITINAPVTLGFGLICVIVFMISLLTQGRSNQYFMTYRSSFASPLTYIRLVTHIFGHASWSHLIGNLSYILLLGPLLEEKYGSNALFEVMLLTAIVTGIINSILFPYTALMGASGVVFALILLSSITSVKNREIPLTFILVVAIFIGQQVYEGIFVNDNISQFTHIIGGLVGSSVGFFMNTKKGKY